ncbi:MAG: indole-3-glycerol-phosphate synthase [Prevotella sp.]|nr:indole-3-glycerol-phosphate synthase [Prevotella sp.]
MSPTKDILDTIIVYKRQEIEGFKSQYPLSLMRSLTGKTLGRSRAISMKEALMCSPTGIIAEYKRKSPSKGWFKQEDLSGTIPLDYQHNGAAALSILTDEHFFAGSDIFIQSARNSGVTLPILYKNFIVDEYQLYQAVLSGASAVLLITAVLTFDECKSLIRRAHELSLEVLLEMHSVDECAYAALEPDMYGVNNRHLGSFVTDVDTSFRMAELLPKDVCMVSESGLSDASTVIRLRQMGYRGFLMGEYFMTTDDPGLTLRRFIDRIQSLQGDAQKGCR